MPLTPACKRVHMHTHLIDFTAAQSRRNTDNAVTAFGFIVVKDVV